MIKSISEMEEGQVLTNVMMRRIKSNQNWLACVVGKTGSGKSYSCLRMAELYYQKKFHKPFPIKHVCWTPEDVMELLVHGNLQKGDLIILEEAGTSMGSLDFQNKVSKIFNYILQTFRSRNIILIMNLPFFSLLNKQTRMMLHMKIITLDIDRAKKQTIVSAYHLQWVDFQKEPYRHTPQVIVDGCYEKIHEISYNLPSDKLRNDYEKEKDKFVKDLSIDVLATIKKQQNKDKNSKGLPVVDKYKQPLQTAIMERCVPQGIIRPKDIAEYLGITPQVASKTIISMRKRGIFIENMGKSPKTPYFPKIST